MLNELNIYKELYYSTDSMEEAKYTNWQDHDNSINRECMLLTGNGKQWKQQYCMTPKHFFCQSGTHDRISDLTVMSLSKAKISYSEVKVDISLQNS